MSRITVSAKTVEEAITEASIQLGLASTDIEVEVIEKGSAGFLGIGAKQAVIKAWKKGKKDIAYRYRPSGEHNQWCWG